MQDQESILKAAIESANDAIIITNSNLDWPNPLIEYVNPAFTHMTGWALEDVIGKSPRILQGPKTPQALKERLKRDLLNNQEFFGEAVNYRKDGSEYFVEWRITPVRNPQGEISQWVAIQRDVTSRVLAEKDLRKAKDEAEAASRAKDEFLATLSHELRTPLTAIVGWSSMIRAGKLKPESMIEAGATIERNAKAQAQLINDILDTSRIVTGRLTLDISSINVTNAILAAVETIKTSANEKHLNLHVTGNTKEIKIKADFGRIQQVIWNLLQNAIKFTPEYGDIFIDIAEQNGNAIICIQDSGEGIEPSFIEHLFERFTQEETSNQRRHGGLGLGLAIVKNIVGMHGGTVNASSEGKGKGSLFVVTLPIHPIYGEDNNHTPTGTFLKEDRDFDLNGYHILVIEDHDDSRDYVKAVLRANGALVSEASSVTEAESLIQRESYDLIISDIAMPVRDGYSFIEAFRRSEKRQNQQEIPVIALTAFASVDDMNKIIASGFNAHMGKPANAHELINNIAKLLKIK